MRTRGHKDMRTRGHRRQEDQENMDEEERGREGLVGDSPGEQQELEDQEP